MTDIDRRMLDLAGAWWNYAGNLEQTVRDEFGISLTRFWQKVGQLCDTREALEYAPATVNRLRRMREARQVSRASRR
ncbi:helix-turn-helix DNA-binding protein [Gordonia phage Clark]|uniref:Helix-turn-helix DNA binding domain protein n=5 Tax=Beenievirus TaxID=3044673 RepID=A0AAE8XCT6_9CAUD|nr:helix-turn-helix DNA-binding protein [Gordonia phage Beenie]YP_010654208.1 helix-turn-helix DNA binding domain protein [Gordonia phage Dolores]YP_010654435.1 helix-turn-helix DNA-binding protein [Gordonia phage Clark]YP_010654514.1 helix-turn-helix DNA binding domain protein [Gordonia phage Samman98]YP_010654593.1 helix-turn-helix DNA binding domain protein [Gordonia phage MichaelScott]URM87941.1 helix-turn-helix DNA-binding domain protein [Gordonia phage WinkNick]AUV61599.1 helix-turn-hel